jgi:uncharacterized protein YggL (DUF469 family)
MHHEEYRMVMTRHGRRPLRYGGSAYPRISAYDKEQALRFVEEERKEGHHAWVECRKVSDWKKFKP